MKLFNNDDPDLSFVPMPFGKKFTCPYKSDFICQMARDLETTGYYGYEPDNRPKRRSCCYSGNCEYKGLTMFKCPHMSSIGCISATRTGCTNLNCTKGGKMTLRYVLGEGGKAPTKGTNGSNGYDLYMPCDIEVKAHAAGWIPLGIRFHIPEGYFLEILPRSSTLNKGFIVPTTIIDCDYRGEVHASLYNYTNEDIFIKAGTRLVQFVIRKTETLYLHEVDQIDFDTNRGINGCGSTGS